MKSSAVSIVILLFLIALSIFPAPGELDLIWGPSPLENDDIAYSFWLVWYLGEHVEDLVSNPREALKTDLLFYPEGFDIYLETPNIMGPLLSILPVGVFGFPLGVNILVLVLVLANALAAWWFLRRLGIGPWPSLTGALMFSMNPFVADQIVYYRFEHIILFFIPLFIINFIRMLHGSRKHTVITVLFYLLICLNDWFHGIFMALFGLAVVGRALWSARSSQRMDWKLVLKYRFIPFCLLVTSCLLPFLFPFGEKLLHGEQVFGLSLDSGLRLSAASQQTAGSGQFIETVGSQGILDIIPPMYLVLVVVFLILSLRHWRKTGFWVGVGCCFYLLALGRKLSLWPGRLEIPLPFLVLEWLIPPLSRLSQTIRFLPFCLIAWAVAIGKGQELFLARLKNQWSRIAVVAVTVLLLFAFSYSRQMLSRNPAPKEPGYQNLLTGSPSGAVINLPWGTGLMSATAVYLQTMHGRPILGGSGVQLAVGIPPGLRKKIEGNGALSFLVNLGKEEKAIPTGEELRDLSSMGFRYVVLHRVTFSNDIPVAIEDSGIRPSPPGTLGLEGLKRFLKVKSILKQILGPPIFEDNQSLLYGLPD